MWDSFSKDATLHDIPGESDNEVKTGYLKVQNAPNTN